MSIKDLVYLIGWDLRINHGMSFDNLRAKLLLVELRLEQYIYRKSYRPASLGAAVWYLCRFLGSVFQWFLCNSNIPGTTTIGRGLSLPHPQNIIIAGYSKFGEFCTIYHNVSVARNGFKPTKPLSPQIGDHVLLGANAILIGDITIGKNVLVGAGTTVSESIPENSRVTGIRPQIISRSPSNQAAEPGSPEHLVDPYSIWR
jgi:serine acetyltransferase